MKTFRLETITKAAVAAAFALGLFATRSVALSNQNAVSSRNASINYGQPFTPAYIGGSGTGAWQFCIVNYTGWDSSQNTGTYVTYTGWVTAVLGGWWGAALPAGTYQFYVQKNGDSYYNPSGAAGPYTLTIVKANQSPISSLNPTPINQGQAFGPPQYYGGSGSGNWQFCLAGFTGWDTTHPFPNQDVGTNVIYANNSTAWVTSVSNGWWGSALPAGNITFYVQKDGDATYSPASPAGPYTLQIIGLVNGITWNSISMPSYGLAGQTIAFTANVTNSGTTTWGSTYYLQLADQNGNHLYYPSISGVAPNGSITATFYLTLPSAPGNYTYNFEAEQNGVMYFRPVQTKTIFVDAQPVPPSFTTQPQGRSVASGATVTFTAMASGTPAPTYQWYRNSGAIANATSASYSISNVQLSNAGNYTVVATNTAGSATSSVATLTVTVMPAFTTQPQSQSVTSGASVTFTAAASGTPSPTYQWYFNGTGITGATNPSYTISSVQTSNAGSYKVTVTNSAGSVTSNSVTLTVNSPPVITGQPAPQTVNVGQSATFNVTATGTAPLTYQWFKDSATISGATAASYTISNVQTSNAGSYKVTVSNAVGSATSIPVALAINTLTLTVNNGTGGGSYMPGTSVPISGNPPSGYHFTSWTLNSGSGTIGNTSSRNTTFTMGSANAMITANSANDPPIGWLDSATSSLSPNQNLMGNGWAADNETGSPVNHIDIRIDGTTVCQASLGVSRPDVASAYGRPDYTNSGTAVRLLEIDE